MESRSFPNAWESNEQRQKQQQQQQQGLQNPSVQFRYIGIDGTREAANLGDYSPTQLCCLACCPCIPCGGGGDAARPSACSAANREAYARCVPTFLFIVSCVQVVMLVASIALGGGFAPVSCNPMLGPNACPFVTLGGANRLLIGSYYQLWRLFCPSLLHAGILHLAFNLYAQLRFGIYLERRWRLKTTVLVYVTSAVGGALLSVCTQDGVSVGASAAIMGMLGAHTIEIVCLWSELDPLERRCTLAQMLVWIVVILLVSLSPIVDAGGHLGGLLTGALISLTIFADKSTWRRSGVLAARWAAGGGLLAFFSVLLVLVFAPVDGRPAAEQCRSLCAMCPSFCQTGALQMCPLPTAPSACN